MRIAELIVDLKANISEFRTSMQSASASVQSLESTFVKAKDALVDFLAVREIISVAREAANATQEWAFSIDHLSRLTGISNQQAGVFLAIAKEQGVSAEAVGTFIQRLSVAIATHEDRLKKLGIATRDSNGQLLSTQQIMVNSIGTLDTYKAGLDRDAAATFAFGRAGAGALTEWERFTKGLNPENITRVTALINALGLAVDENGVARAREWEEAEADLGIVLLGVQNQIGQALLPLVKDFSDAVVHFVQTGDLQRWASDAAAGLRNLVSGVRDTIAQFKELNAQLQPIADVLNAINSFRLGSIVSAADTLTRVTTAADLAGLSVGGVERGLNALIEQQKKLRAEVGNDPGGLLGASKFDEVQQRLKGITADIAVYQAKLHELKDLPASTIIGGEPPPAPRGFTAPAKTSAISHTGKSEAEKSAEEFHKLSLSMAETTRFENELTVAWTKGAAAAQLATDKHTALLAVARLGPGATKAQIDSIYAQSIAETAATERAKASQKATEDRARAAKDAADSLSDFTSNLRDHIRYEQGYALAVTGTKEQLKAYEQTQRDEADLARASIGWTQQQIAAARQLQAIDAQATSAGELAKETADKMRDAGREIADTFGRAFTDLVKPGADLEQTLFSIIDALEQMIIKLIIMKPLEDALGNWMASLGGSGGGGGLSSIFGSLFGGAGASAGGSGLFGSGLSGGGLYPGFASGGSFDVGGSGGTDSQMVAFRATPGEHVQVGGGSGGGSQIVNIHNHTAEPAQVQRQRNGQGTEMITVTIGKAIAHDIRSGGDVALAMRDVHGDRRQPIQR